MKLFIAAMILTLLAVYQGVQFGQEVGARLSIDQRLADIR